NKKYDIIISTELIEHIPDFEKDFVFKNMQDLLLEGGKLILTTPNGIIKRHHFSGGRVSWKQPVEDWMKKKELKSKLENQGLKVICHVTFYNTWMMERYPKTWLYLFFNNYTVSLFKITRLDALIEFLIKKFRLGIYQLIIAQKNRDE
ncbi:MAG: class I SAM-dependent methyltransferase, partial [Lewinella sp.]|uniref:class I SAM-dependent methyltransferase n=1 Tax=Lewinella sp. TaxID=2004506 RepID=UPI003D6B4DC4